MGGSLAVFFSNAIYLTDKALEWLLRFLYILLKTLGMFSIEIGYIADKLPHSLYKHAQYAASISHGSDAFQKRVVCKSCGSLYNTHEFISKTGSVISGNTCNFKPFPRARMCGEILMREVVSASGNKRHYPYQIYCFTSFITGLQNLVLRSNFLQDCESTRNKFSSVGYADVYDGEIWKEFQTVDGCPFLSVPYSYGLLMNIDWFQPFEHTVYSVGVIYIAFPKPSTPCAI